jgi:predicted DNA binding CopG/RHH family protein
MNKKIVLPDFNSEEDEANWWDAHREEHDEAMGEAIASGSVLRLQDFLRDEGLLVERSNPVAIPVMEGDVARAQRQASQRGMSYEDYLALILHEALTSQDAA